jgi:hypothetical protein
VFVFLGLAAGPVDAQRPESPQPPDVDAAAPPLEPVPSPTAGKPAEKETSFASLFAGRGGRRVLLVDYPWARHDDASIEIRLLSGEAPGAEEIRPLGFVARHFRGKVRMKVFDVQDAAATGDTARPLTVDETEFEIVGSRTSLGSQAVYLVRSIPPQESPPGAAAVYCLLPAWSINRGLLHLDLPREHFAPAGKLRVWFLRGRDILWAQTLEWPGMK